MSIEDFSLSKTIKNIQKLEIKRNRLPSPINKNSDEKNGGKTKENTIVEDFIKDDKTSKILPSFYPFFKENIEKKTDKILDESFHEENSDFLQEFLREAKENIKEVIDLLHFQENSLEISEKTMKNSEELAIIRESLIKMKDFSIFLRKITRFTKAIIEELQVHLSELKTIKTLINSQKNAEKPEELRPSIENLAILKQSDENFKIKLMNSIEKSDFLSENPLKERIIAKNIEEIERNLLKMRSIHRKNSYISSENNDNLLCNSYENLLNNEKIGDFSHENLKGFYEKLLEKQEQIVFEDYKEVREEINEKNEENHLKIMRNTKEQLLLLQGFLKEKP